MDNFASNYSNNEIIDVLEPQMNLLMENILLDETRNILDNKPIFTINLSEVLNFMNFSKIQLEESQTNWNLMLMKKVTFDFLKKISPKIKGVRCSFFWEFGRKRVNFAPKKIIRDVLYYGDEEDDFLPFSDHNNNLVLIPCIPRTMKIPEFANINNYYISGLHNIFYQISKKNFELLYEDYLSSNYTLNKFVPKAIIYRYYAEKRGVVKTEEKDSLICPYYLDEKNERFVLEPIHFYQSIVGSRLIFNMKWRNCIYNFCTRLIDCCKI